MVEGIAFRALVTFPFLVWDLSSWAGAIQIMVDLSTLVDPLWEPANVSLTNDLQTS